MIRFVKKADATPLPTETDSNRFEQIREAAVEGHKKAGTEGTRRRAQKAVEDDRLL